MLGSHCFSLVIIKHYDTVLLILKVARLEKIKIIKERFLEDHTAQHFLTWVWITKNKGREESLDKNGISVNKKTKGCKSIRLTKSKQRNCIRTLTLGIKKQKEINCFY